MSNKSSRRDFLTKGAIAGAAFVALEGKNIGGVFSRMGTKDTKTRLNGNSLDVEANTTSGEYKPKEGYRVAFNKCWGCLGGCSVKLKINDKTDTIERVWGNPYSPMSRLHPLPYNTSVKDALLEQSAYEDKGVTMPATSCGRGNAVIDAIYNKNRITHCLKRVGKRGEGKWKRISYEKLIDEVVNGGNLFGEGNVEGLKDIRDTKTLANPKYPEFGAKSNQLFGTCSPFIASDATMFKRFFVHSFGSKNYGNKGSYCGMQQYFGSGLAYSDGMSWEWPVPDYENCQFALLLGFSPTQAGDNFKRQAITMSAARARGMKYAMVQPLMKAETPSATKDNGKWVPVKPNGDSALIKAIFHKIFSEGWENRDYMKYPNLAVAQKNGETTYTNATHLLLMPTDDKEPRYLRMSDFGKAKKGDKKDGKYVMLKGKLTEANKAKVGDIYYEGTITINGEDRRVKSAAKYFKDDSFKYTLEEYSKLSGTSLKDIEYLAYEWTHNGRSVAAITSTGSNGTESFWMAYSLNMLHNVVGSHNAKGGSFFGGGSYTDKMMDNLYKLDVEDGITYEQLGVYASRHEAKYEDSTEYRDKVNKGENPYPASTPWFELGDDGEPDPIEMMMAHINKDPFTFKAWIQYRSNILYAAPGQDEIEKNIKDPKNLPLIIGIDVIFNETNKYADYMVPALAQFEEWSVINGGFISSAATSVGFPATEIKTEISKDGNHIGMEQFFIDVAKKMGLKGYGKGAIRDKDGNRYDYNKAEDFYPKMFANIAYTDFKLPDASEEDIKISSVYKIMPTLKASLKEDEVKKVAYMLSRGGKFESDKDKYDKTGKWHNYKVDYEMQFFNEGLTNFIHSFDGKQYSGIPVLEPQKFWDGSTFESKWSKKEYPMLAFGYKSGLYSAHTIWHDRLRAIKADGLISMNIEDAKALGIKAGDAVKLTTPRKSVKAVVTDVSSRVIRGAIGIEYHFGHTEFGARSWSIDGKKFGGDKSIGNGISLNNLVPGDPTRPNNAVIQERYTGCEFRQGVPMRVEKI